MKLNTKDISYRRIDENDLDSLVDLSKEIWIPAFRHYIEPDRLLVLYNGMYNKEKLLSDLLSPDTYFYFIEIKKELKGYFALIFRKEKLKLDKIYIHRKYQGQGFGQYILDEIKKIALHSNTREIELRVNRKNETAIEFYKKNGFIITASIDIPADNGFVYDDYVMNYINR